MDFEAEFRFPGLGVIDRKVHLPNPSPNFEIPVVCRISRMADVPADGADFKRYHFVNVGMYPSEWLCGKVTKLTVIYELQDII
jgi:hypothetical protein